ALRDGKTTCVPCGAPVDVRYDQPYLVDDDFPALQDGEHGAFIKCPACGFVSNMPLRFLAFGMPEVQDFWKRHPRLRLRPEKTLIVSGARTLVVGAESIVSDDAIEVFCSHDNFSVVGVRTLPLAISSPIPSPTSQMMASG